MKKFFKFLRVVHLRYKPGIFTALTFVSSFYLVHYVARGRKQSQLIASCGAQTLGQEMWLGRKGEISQKFDDTCSKLKSSENLNDFLMDFVEKAASECDCKYELSNEHSHRI
jgi:hypothetical protein